MKPKSALEELVEAARVGPGKRPDREAERRLAALASGMARELIDVVEVLEEAKHFADHNSNLAGAASLFAMSGSALARLEELGEAAQG